MKFQTETEQDEFIQVYNTYSDAIFRHCYFRVFDRERAKELVQEAFMRTWQYLADGKEVQNIKAFLYRVANNLIIDESRKKKSLSLDQLKEDGFDPGFDEAESIQNKIDADSVKEVITQLDEKYRQAVLMRYVDGFSPQEISRIIGETENVVSVRIHRGLKQLIKIYGN